MKKHILRVKQLADQTFLRADKTEVLNHEELQVAEHKVEYIRNAVTAISKRIPSVSNEKVESVEKRMKKYPEYQLGAVLLEQSSRKRDPEQSTRSEDECFLFPSVLRDCGIAEQDLAKEQAEHEIKVEQMVSSPLQVVLENDIPNILKQKRHLSKYILDKDSANNRYNASKNGMQKESLRDDMDEADTKVEQGRDVLAAEMFSLLRKENELSQYVLQLLKLQRGYHESALKNLEKVIPHLEKQIGDSSVKAIFGTNLVEHLRVTGRKIAYPLELCICALTELGMTEEGILRVAGGTSRVRRLKLSLDSGCFKFPLIPEYRDVHVIASTLKLYLRDLPEPLLTHELYNKWVRAMNIPEESRLTEVQNILKELPPANKDNLTYLIHFLAKLAKHPENKMPTSNIAIVVAPNLLWKEKNMDMGNCTTFNLIVELFISKVDVLFPEDPGVYVTLTKDMLLNEDRQEARNRVTTSSDDEFQRPVLQNVKLIEPDTESTTSEATDSPKPQFRRKTKLAPVPPASTNKIVDSTNERVSSYPSGSSTLNRLHKVKEENRSPKVKEEKVKTSTGTNTDDSRVKRKSLVSEADTHNKMDAPNPQNLVNLEDRTVDHKYISQPAANVQISKAKPVQQAMPQNFVTEAVFRTGSEQTDSRPIAAPRSIITDAGLNRTPSVRGESAMSKSLNSIDAEGDVRLRKSDNNPRPKPEVPLRPPSLRTAPRSSIDGSTDPLHKTQCSTYNIHKHQTSIVNIPKHQPGHDTQIAEKEKFLGHQSERTAPLPRRSLENRFDDLNSNCAASNRSRTSSVGDSNKPETTKFAKSNEKLDAESSERTNGNQKSSHVRTRSDGNLIDLANRQTLNTSLRTPPLPRSINKPTLPPPPPPNVAKHKSEPESTNM